MKDKQALTYILIALAVAVLVWALWKCSKKTSSFKRLPYNSINYPVLNGRDDKIIARSIGLSLEGPMGSGTRTDENPFVNLPGWTLDKNDSRPGIPHDVPLVVGGIAQKLRSVQ